MILVALVGTPRAGNRTLQRLGTRISGSARALLVTLIGVPHAGKERGALLGLRGMALVPGTCPLGMTMASRRIRNTQHTVNKGDTMTLATLTNMQWRDACTGSRASGPTVSFCHYHEFVFH